MRGHERCSQVPQSLKRSTHAQMSAVLVSFGYKCRNCDIYHIDAQSEHVWSIATSQRGASSIAFLASFAHRAPCICSSRVARCREGGRCETHGRWCRQLAAWERGEQHEPRCSRAGGRVGTCRGADAVAHPPSCQTASGHSGAGFGLAGIGRPLIQVALLRLPAATV